MYQAVAQSIAYGIDLDDLTQADTELIENLQGLDHLRAATKNSTSKMKPIAQTLRSSLSQTQPLNSRFRWFFTASEKKERALSALQEITYLVGEPTTIALARLPETETVHALTIHKSQGSEYEHVVVVLPQSGSRIVTRELLYTGITRPQKRLTLVATLASIETAIKTPIRRATGLAERL
jgi:superfamily I DNA/RNA helicase